MLKLFDFRVSKMANGMMRRRETMANMTMTHSQIPKPDVNSVNIEALNVHPCLQISVHGY